MSAHHEEDSDISLAFAGILGEEGQADASSDGASAKVDAEGDLREAVGQPRPPSRS